MRMTGNRKNQNQLPPQTLNPEMLDILLSNISDHIYLYDQEGRYLYMSPNAEKALGLQRGEGIGKTWRELQLPPEIMERFERQLRKVFASGQSLRDETEFFVDGTLYYYEYILTPASRKQGIIESVVASVRDVTERVHTEKALWESEERFQSFLNNNPSIAWMKDEQGRYVYLSGTFERKYGVRAEDWLGKTDFELRPLQLAQQFWDNDRAVLASGNELNLTQEMVNPDGSTSYWRVVKFPFIDASGKMHVAGIGLEITECKKAEDALQEATTRLQAHMDNSPLGIIEFDAEFRVIMWSESAERMFGWKADEIVGKSIDEIHWVHPDDRELVYELSREMLAGRKPRSLNVNRNYRKDGSVIYCEWYNSAVHDDKGRMTSVFSLVLDVTERQKREKEIKDYTLRLQRAYQDMEAFTYAVSHDLKAPLIRIKGFSDILAADYVDILDEKGREILKRIAANAKDMANLIEDLLNYSRLDKQTVNPFEIDMTTLIAEIFSELRSVEGERKIELKLGEIPRGYGDPVLIRQLLINLLSNAIKFTRNENRAIIEVGSIAGKEENIYYVRDNGIGFNMAYQEKLFGLFQRIHTEKQFEGTGVGLVIVKKIVERHGGRVWAEGEPNQGAKFFFTLPSRSYKDSHT